MGKVIVADENQGRRTLLATTLEREGFEVTRAGTLRQAEGTALAVMPEVVLIDGEWKSGDAIDAAQRLMGTLSSLSSVESSFCPEQLPPISCWSQQKRESMR